jgi:hypothetical protein
MAPERADAPQQEGAGRDAVMAEALELMGGGDGLIVET